MGAQTKKIFMKYQKIKLFLCGRKNITYKRWFSYTLKSGRKNLLSIKERGAHKFFSLLYVQGRSFWELTNVV